jgi:hypothetical protein
MNAIKLLKHEEGIGFEQSADVPGALLCVSSLVLRSAVSKVTPSATDEGDCDMGRSLREHI